MCYERWARHRDAAVESRWLRELYAREEDAPRPREASRPAEDEPPAEVLAVDALEAVGVD